MFSAASRSTRAVFCAFVFSIFTLDYCALAQDYCNDVLVRDLGNKVVLQTNQESALATAHAQCAQNSNSSSGSSGTTAGGSFEGIGANFGHDSTNNQSNTASNCGSEGSDAHTSAALYYSQSVYHDVVDAWKQCMINHHQFACWADNSGSSTHLVIHAQWNILSLPPTVVSSNISIGNEPSKPAFNSGSRLYLNDNLIYVDRKPNQDVTVSIVASGSNLTLDARA